MKGTLLRRGRRRELGLIVWVSEGGRDVERCFLELTLFVRFFGWFFGGLGWMIKCYLVRVGSHLRCCYCWTAFR